MEAWQASSLSLNHSLGLSYDNPDPLVPRVTVISELASQYSGSTSRLDNGRDGAEENF
jgi:hypothetical protein